MRNQRLILVLLLLCLTLFLTGCWDRRELNELAITVALGIDQEGDEFKVSTQVVVPSELSKDGKAGQSAVTLFEAKGETMYEALRSITTKSSRKLYPGHLRMVVVSEALAKEGVAEALEFLSRAWELRSDFYIVVAKEMDASEILNVTTPLERIPAEKMFKTLETSAEAWSVTRGVTLDDFSGDIVSDGKNPVLTGVIVTGNQNEGSSNQNVESVTPPARIVYDHLALFKKDKLIGWLTEEESRNYNYITDAIKESVTTISCPEEEGKASIEIMGVKTKLKGNVKNGEPEVDIKIKVEGNVGAVECYINLDEPKNIDELEQIYEQEMKESIQKTIETVQNQYKTDVFGFGEAIHRSNPKPWEEMKDEWDEKFVNMTANVEVDLTLKLTGTVSSSFMKSLRE